MAKGTVKWFDEAKGYGFITREDGEDLFVHFTQIDHKGYRRLEQGEDVEFDVERGPKGLQAVRVRSLAREARDREARRGRI